MPRTLDQPPGEPPPPTAYPTPWRVAREDPRHPVVTNVGDEPVVVVRAFVSDRDGCARTDHWGTLSPGDAVELCLCEAHLPSTLVTLAWYRPGTDDEYLWRFVL